MAKKPAAAPSKDLAESRVVIIQGKEAFLRTERTNELRDALQQRHGGLDVFTFDGNTATPADVLDECRSFGLMAQHKLVIVEDADELLKVSEEDEAPRAISPRVLFERYAEAPCDGATLVLRAGTWRPGKLDKIVDEVGMVITCTPLSDNEAKTWAVKRGSAVHKAKLDPEAASLLVMRVGTDLSKLDSELGKLAAAAGETGAITPALVSEFVQPTREEAAWNIQATLLQSDTQEALAHLRYVLDVSRHPPQLVMYAMVDLARKIHGASRALRQGTKPFEVTKALKLWGPSVEPVMRVAGNASPDNALRLLRECVQGDTRSKSGFGEIERTLERLVVRFSQLARPAQAVRR